MIIWTKDEGEIMATCTNCERVYYMANAWDMANLDWHDCGKAGV